MSLSLWCPSLIYSNLLDSNPMSGGIDWCLCVMGLNLTLESVERETDLVRKVTLIIYYCYLNNNNRYNAVYAATFSSK